MKNIFTENADLSLIRVKVTVNPEEFKSQHKIGATVRVHVPKKQTDTTK